MHQIPRIFHGKLLWTESFHGEVASTGKQSLERWLEKYKSDNGATMYWRWVRTATKLDPFGNRDEFAHVTLADAVKVCFLVHLLYHICKKQGRKAIVFTEWPFRWLVELTLQNLDFKVLMIRAKHKSFERTVAMKEFNRKESDVDVLIISTKLRNSDQNMQHDCCDVVFVDTWPFVSNVAQCGGRVHRIEQTKICHFYTINLDHSYDQMIQENVVNKMLGILASMGAVELIAEEIFTDFGFVPIEHRTG